MEAFEISRTDPEKIRKALKDIEGARPLQQHQALDELMHELLFLIANDRCDDPKACAKAIVSAKGSIGTVAKSLEWWGIKRD